MYVPSIKSDPVEFRKLFRSRLNDLKTSEIPKADCVSVVSDI